MVIGSDIKCTTLIDGSKISSLVVSKRFGHCWVPVIMGCNIKFSLLFNGGKGVPEVIC